MLQKYIDITNWEKAQIAVKEIFALIPNRTHAYSG